MRTLFVVAGLEDRSDSLRGIALVSAVLALVALASLKLR